ncbi:hypothetical protein [Streptomyces sp. NBC_00385]|uniref:hypothetical protein n=1 Tax=Streptomyces sp. NBC_00385 TaxID=2975733 RepID=UPI002DDB6576|nr:hypothetical protein [Streptomyces sp. NBC_00385]WRZ04653.1 hypothetical protein OG959_15435 [Streptomyces sp. NBC_00385]
MEFRDWFRRGDRRQAAAPVPGASGDDTPAAGPELPEEDVRPVSREADWDGGWRRVAPPAVTVARSSIGVSDGLRFRSRLASWQNIAYGGELGHAVLPSAPVGLIHGVTRPGTARPTTDGTPLLLRAAAVRTEPEPELSPGQAASSVAPGRASDAGRRGGQPGAGTGSGAGPRGATVRAGSDPAPVVRAPAASVADVQRSAAPVTRAASDDTAPATVTRPAPVRPRRTAPALIVARRPVAAPRRLAAFVTPGTTVPSSPVGPTAGPGETSGPAERTAGPGATGTHRPDAGERLPAAAPPERAPDLASAAHPVRPALGKPLRELPTHAAPFALPGRDGSESPGPAAPQGPALPVVQRQAEGTATPVTASPAPAAPSAERPRQSAERRSAQRQSAERPVAERRRPTPGTAPTPGAAPTSGTAPESGPSATRAGTPAPPGPAPSVQPAPAPRPQAPAPGGPGSQARTRGGLGAPLSSLPPTAGPVPGAPLLGDPRRTRPGTTGPLPGGGSTGLPQTPATASPPPAGMPLRAPAQPGAGPASTAPQPAAVQRAVDTARTPSATSPAASGGPARTATSTTSTSASNATPPVPTPVRVRRIGPRGQQGQAPGPATGGGHAAVAVQRSRALLARRTLTVSTGAAEGFSAPVPATTSRPVVAATWRRDAQRRDPDGPPSSSSEGPGAQTRARQATQVRQATQTTQASTQATQPTNRAAQASSRAAQATRAATRATPAARATLQRSAPVAPRGTAPAVRRVTRAPQAPPPATQSTSPTPPASRTPRTPPASPTPPAAPPVPVVRPHPPGSVRPGGAVPVQRLQLPVVPETGAPAVGPAPPDDAPTAAPQALTVRASRPVPARPGPAQGGGGPGSPAPRSPAAGNRATGSQAQAVQRAVAEAGLSGVPVRVVQAKSARTPAASADAPAAGPNAPRTPQPNEAAGVDIEELARRLLDPVSRLLRADLRRGRERSGRPYDGRR